MYKVLVVDDEMLIRKRIRLGFEWEEMGFSVEEDVGSGQEALELIRKGQYDLAIVDIAMPGMNGMELVKQLREEKNPIQIIFLTGHSDFAYARQAITYGVYDYILKPVDEEEFTRTLEKLRDKLDKERKKQAFLNHLAMRQGNAGLVLESKFFSELFHYGMRNQERETLEIKIKEAGVNPDQTYILAVLRIQRYIRENRPLLERCECLYEAGRKVMGGSTFTVICDLFDNYCILFKELTPTDSVVRIEENLEQMRYLLEEKLDTTIRCGISSGQKGMEQLLKGYREAICALNNTKVFGRNTLRFEEVAKKDGSHYRVSTASIKELKQCVGENDQEECEKLIRGIFTEMAERQCDYDSISMNMNRLLLEISETCIASGLELRMFMGEYKSLDAAFEDMLTLEELEEWFCNILKDLSESKHYQVSAGKNLPIVQRTCEYMQEHQKQAELTQGKIAEAMGVTPAYLSGVFKKAMGISMTQYLTMIRLERARELLICGELEVREVAEQVGYGDEYYFSRCFKRYHGISPSQVRKRKK